MSKGDFIYCERGAYPKEFCDKHVKFFEDNMEKASPGVYTKEEDTIDNLEITIDTRRIRELQQAIFKGVVNYKKRYPLIDQSLTAWLLYPLCQLMRYEPNKYYGRIHCENDCYKRPYVERCFAWMIYLNTIKKGGGTEFIHQKVTARPRAGDFYMWPAGWTHMHRGVNAPNEVKYILTGWFVYGNVK